MGIGYCEAPDINRHFTWFRAKSLKLLLLLLLLLVLILLLKVVVVSFNLFVCF